MKIRMKVIMALLCGASISGWSQDTVTAGATTAKESAGLQGQVRAANAPLSARAIAQANEFGRAQAAAGSAHNPALSTLGFQYDGARKVGDVSVVCFDNPDQKTLAETSEDLSILSYLLSRNLERAFATDAGDNYKLGIPMLLTSQRHSVDATYIQGFGVLLKMQVRFPLMPLAENENTNQSPKTNSEWEEARRALESGPADMDTSTGSVHPYG